MGLELVAVSLGLCTFSDMLRNKRVVVHCDNKGAEVRSYCSFVFAGIVSLCYRQQ